ncbi:MAG: amidohydrolase family protein [Candidatus Omnitrophica bacterium]|nr:amidohydrolase family protein [Candidatus Omnitrophota bacterium]
MHRLKERFFQGKPLGLPLYDIHGHVGGFSRDYPVFGGQIDQLLEEMDRIGVKRSLVFALGVYGTELRYQNDKVIKAGQRYPERFSGLALVNLNYPEKDILQELERCRSAGLVGAKLIACYQGAPAESQKIEAVCEYAHHHQLIVLNHGWGTPEFLRKMAEIYSAAQYICGHLWLAAARVVNEFDNVWMCTCAYLSPLDLQQAVETMKPERICWGSDLSDLHWGFTLGPILLSSLPEKVKKMILSTNTRELFRKLGLEKESE